MKRKILAMGGVLAIVAAGGAAWLMLGGERRAENAGGLLGRCSRNQRGRQIRVPAAGDGGGSRRRSGGKIPD